MRQNNEVKFDCPLPLNDYPMILLAHGGGGKLMHELIRNIFAAAFDNPMLETTLDSAVLNAENDRPVFTTDSYVVHPLFFPGGDIGMLAVNGTINDLAMCGARPRYISAGFIIEEGFSTESLWKIARSMSRAARQSMVDIVTGDTKVVDRGRGHGVFINTAGIGFVEHGFSIKPASIRAGDVIIVNGDLGRHGIAIMAAREGLSFESQVESDCAPLAETVLTLLDAGAEIHCMRDLTRGGLASALVEIAQICGMKFSLDELLIPVREDIRGACEILGLDPIYVANEGRLVLFAPEKDEKRILEIMRSDLDWHDSRVIGRVTDQIAGVVTMRSSIGSERIVDMLSGEQLPRIC
ncbi:MAG: hydrogenase expression/formation protein HypE [Candidatus Zixiibacteriota bacterium]|nr:MAG: hydrogenase expression/formation protein HypE [candidate division Zixibacteria bacterium]